MFLRYSETLRSEIGWSSSYILVSDNSDTPAVTTYVDSSSQGVVEPLNELDTEKDDISTDSDITERKSHVRRTLSTSGSTNQRDISTRLDRQVQIPEDTNTRTSWVPEVHALEADAALHVAGDLTLGRLGVDFGDGVEELDDVGGSGLSGRDVRDEGEDVASLDGSEGGTLCRGSVRD